MENLIIEVVKITMEPQWVGTVLQNLINIIVSIYAWHLIILFIKESWNK